MPTKKGPSNNHGLRQFRYALILKPWKHCQKNKRDIQQGIHFWVHGSLSVLDHFNMFSMYAETSLRLSSLSNILFLLDSFYWFTDQNLFAYAGTTCNSILFSLWRSGRSAILSLNFLVRITMILLASNYRNAIMDMVFYIRENYGVCSVNGHGYEKYPTVIDVRWLPKEERGCPLLGLCSWGFPCVSTNLITRNL